MGQASVAEVVVVMSFSAARAAPLIEEGSGAGKRRSGCRDDIVLIEERSGAGKRRSGCRGDVVDG